MNNQMSTPIFLMLIFSIRSCPDDRFCRGCVSKISKECELCSAAYLLPNGTCQPITSHISNCVKYYDNEDFTCGKCDLWYYLISNRCKVCDVKGCAICKTPGTCSACFNSVRIRNGVSCDSSFQCSDPTCEVCNEADQCLKCKEKFGLTESQTCAPAPLNCHAVGLDPTKCILCNSLFFLKGDGSCVQITPHSSVFFFGLISVLLTGAVLFFHFMLRRQKGLSSYENPIISA